MKDLKNYFIFFDFAETPQTFLDYLNKHQFGWRCADRVWFVKSKDSAEEVFNNLNKGLNDKDKLVVTEVDKPIFRQGFRSDCDKWFDYKY